MRAKGISLKNKALGLGLALGFIVLAVTDLAFFSAHARHVVRGWESMHGAVLKDWHGMCQKAFDRGQAPLLKQLAGIVLLGPMRIDYSYLADARGKLLAHSDPRFSSSTLASWRQTLPRRGIIERRKSLPLPDGSTGWVGIGYPEPSQDTIVELVKTQRRELLPPVFLANMLILLLVGGFSIAIAKTVIRPVETLAKAVRQVSGGDLGAQVQVSGSDELSALEQDFNAMALRLRQIEDLKSDFLGKVTHDLRSPLGAVMGHAELLLMGIKGPLNEEQKASLHAVTRSAKYLNGLIANILDMTKIEAGRMEYVKSETDLAETVSAVVSLMRAQAEQYKVSLAQSADAPLPPLMADAQALRRLLTNLVSNALKFTPEGGRVEVQARTNGAGVLVGVRDTGIGIPPDKLAAVFGKFAAIHERKDLPRRVPGTGLGLAICKEIVEGHGGRLWVESVPGAGTAFFFTLPGLEA